MHNRSFSILFLAIYITFCAISLSSCKKEPFDPKITVKGEILDISSASERQFSYITFCEQFEDGDTAERQIIVLQNTPVTAENGENLAIEDLSAGQYIEALVSATVTYEPVVCYTTCYCITVIK